MTQLQAELARLRSQLNERELKLTDVQLEALASTHQVNQLRDQISRLYSEMEHLRTDNERLHMLVQRETPTRGPIPQVPTKKNCNDNGAKVSDSSVNAAGEQMCVSGCQTSTNMSRIEHGNRHCLCGSEIGEAQDCGFDIMLSRIT